MLENLLYLLANLLCLTEEAFCLRLQSMWLWDNMNIRDLISHFWLSPGHVLHRHTHKKRHYFSLVFPTFSFLLSTLKATVRLQETKSFKAISFQKVIGALKKKKGSGLSRRADHIVLTHSCAASQGWALTGISHHVLGYSTGSGNPFIQWQWVLQLNHALCK